ncbi:hypothetical protein FQN50_006654 [Emmonsiellopsis sp. PD_5]|nr:hypothetical protein FQN50_006654 [Emmonsiellopsis sp. PD_5]
MSTTSVYDPDEEEDAASDDSFERGIFPVGFTASSPPLQRLRITSPDFTGPSAPQTKHARSSGSRSRAKVLQAQKKLPVEKYTEILNEFINGNAGGAVAAIKSTLSRSQIGVVRWTPEEKDALFNALERHGKSGIPKIASLVGSKSEMEVRAYIDILHRALEQQQHRDFTTSVALGDIPVAIEIGEECRQVLEDNADALCLQEEQAHNTAGEREHGEMWLVNRHVAAVVEDQLGAENETPDTIENENGDPKEVDEDNNTNNNNNNDETPPSSILATAQLLNTSNWILLSERIFMNPGKRQIEDNWSNLAYEGEAPSMTCEAFADFYTLAISLTRRLIQSSLFFAASRIRALERGGYQRGKLVRREDVGAALDVLRMSHSSREFWTRAARRCKLDVEDIRHRKGYKPTQLTYDEVEEELSLEASRSRTSRASSIAQSTAVSEDLSDSEEEPLSPGSDISGRQLDDNLSDEESLSDPEEAHAATIDQEARRVEESQLWRRLGQSPPPSSSRPRPHADIKMEMESDDEGFTATSRPLGGRKTKQDLVDWRDRVLYHSEWEEFGADTLLVEEEVAENQRERKRRRVE